MTRNNLATASDQRGTSYPLIKKGLSGSALKWLAILTMVIDHIGAFLLAPYLAQGGASLPYDLFQVNIMLRLVGRLAFPLFTFLLVEGFFHTGNLKKYSIQMGVFALVSEIPFDLAQSGLVFDFSSQNVFWTLFIGLLTITFFDHFDEKNKIRWLVPLVGMLISEVFRTDYAAMGILLIFVFYHYHDNVKLRTILSGLVLLIQATAVFSLIPIHLYNGKRGKQNKFFFYFFYPLHLFLFFLIRSLIM